MSNDYYCIQIDFGTPEFDEALKLRYEVLRKPLHMEFDPDDISKEFDSYHIACYHKSTQELAAFLILKPVSHQVLKMRQVAVDPHLQSTGIGSFLVAESESFAKKHHYQKIELHARHTAVDFYKKNGYQSSGSIFQEVGIDHLFMSKTLK
ncbi:MAG: GNAT family N-acetyltransferase [Saprospiraceae bacterium]|nr:GNAT family N-acetyltransferase [Saprospiraceae bacterium]